MLLAELMTRLPRTQGRLVLAEAVPGRHVEVLLVQVRRLGFQESEVPFLQAFLPVRSSLAFGSQCSGGRGRTFVEVDEHGYGQFQLSGS